LYELVVELELRFERGFGDAGFSCRVRRLYTFSFGPSREV
jgi:hypothetical protein